MKFENFDIGHEFIIVEELVSLIDFFLLNENKCNICVSGGSSPSEILKLLSKAIDFDDRTCFLLTDERIVDTRSINSNYNNLILNLGLTSNKIKSMFDNKCLVSSMNDYELYIKKKICKKDKAVIDILILGFGKDGHIASIFDKENQIEYKNEYLFSSKNSINGFKRMSLKMDLLKTAKYTFLISYGQDKYNLLKNNNDQKLVINRYLNGQKNVKWFYSINDNSN